MEKVDIRLYNTLSRKKEVFKPLKKGFVGLYTCGPTVYDYAHIGNLRTYLFEDILRRTLQTHGYKVRHAMNITDVGHLAGDQDFAEDKIERRAEKEGKHPLEIAKFYESKFLSDLQELNILSPSKLLRASESIREQIELIKKLQKKGYIYTDELAVYFDTSLLPDYGKLSGQKVSEKRTGVRAEVVVDEQKRHPSDFALWFFLKGRYTNHILHWPSPWGEGFPGWHIECSAISRKLLGQPFDIHTGGVDHIGTHHTNEIAQSESAFNTPLAHIWMHGEFLLIDAKRMGKSKGNFLTLDYLKEKGFDSLDFRYLTLGAHYRSKLNFTWESLESARNARRELMEFVRELLLSVPDAKKKQVEKNSYASYEKKFSTAVVNDLNIPNALGILWQFIRAYHKAKIKHPNAAYALLLKFDTVLGLELAKVTPSKIPPAIQRLAEKREQFRTEKKWQEADTLRAKIEKMGWQILDTDAGFVLKPM